MPDYDLFAHTEKDDLVAQDYAQQARERFDIHDYDRAIEHFTVAIHLLPRNARIYYERGNAYRLRGDLHRALEDYDSAVHFDPALRDAFYERAHIRKQYANFRGAIADLETYLALCDDLCDEDRALVEQSIRDLKTQARAG